MAILRPRGIGGAGVGVTMNRNYWLDAATREIRFGPDRRRVRQELEDHILDRIEAAKDRGLSDHEAEEAAVLTVVATSIQVSVFFGRYWNFKDESSPESSVMSVAVR